MNSHRGGHHYAGYLIDAGHEDDCGAGHWLLLVSITTSRGLSRLWSPIVFLVMNTSRSSTTGSTEEHRETRGKPTFPVFPCVPCGKDLCWRWKASASVTSARPP